MRILMIIVLIENDQIQRRIQDFPDGVPTPKVDVLTFYFAIFVAENYMKTRMHSMRPPVHSVGGGGGGGGGGVVTFDPGRGGEGGVVTFDPCWGGVMTFDPGQGEVL